MKPAWYTVILLMGPLLTIASGSANWTQPLWNPPPTEGLLVFHHRSSGETFLVGLGRASARVGSPGGASIKMQARVPAPRVRAFSSWHSSSSFPPPGG